MSPKKLTLSVLLLSASLAAHAYEKDKTYRFTVLHSNDTHGRFWKNDKGEYGFSVLKTAIDNVRKEVEAQGGTVILLHAGDFNTGVPESTHSTTPCSCWTNKNAGQNSPSCLPTCAIKTANIW